MKNRDTSTRLDHATGAPVADNLNIETAGPRGPALLQDIWLIEKLAHFDREVIPERRMHAKGSGAHGVFTVTHDITRYTKAKLFSEIGKATPVFMRFSTVAGERGAADAERDIRGFAVKFYTEEGNWDIVGNNTPVFFFRDPLRFPDLNHAIKRDPRTGLRSANSNWDFWTLLPEALHQVTIVMSDRGIPRSYRHMHGFGSHTFSLVDADNRRTWVKFHFRTQQGIANLTDGEAEQLVGKDRETHGRDLYESIERGDFPRWTLFIQVMNDDEARALPFNPFDLTKVWPKSDFPLIEAGVLELNRNPGNYFAEVEQAAFSPANVVPGIGFSPDKMLQARLFSYGDTQRYRLGVNFNHIPVNAPKCPFHSYHRDGAMRTDDNLGGTPSYYPNSSGEWEVRPDLHEPPLRIEGDAAHWDHRVDVDHFAQPGNLFRLMSQAQQHLLFDNTARQMASVHAHIQERHILNCAKADPEYGAGVREALARIGATAATK
ncbi:catalase [Burkholderia cepacia]|uniref:catalase n=1 Tax=Burkholderia cepacia TaxID=292 RepID=UPI002FE2174D